jgi:hypothetical protein
MVKTGNKYLANLHVDVLWPHTGRLEEVDNSEPDANVNPLGHVPVCMIKKVSVPIEGAID